MTTATPTLKGRQVVLREVCPDDMVARQAYGWHSIIERNYGHVVEDRAMTDDEAADWLDAVRQAERDPTRRHWVIEADGTLVGETFLHSISDADRKARFAIGLFHPSYLGRGYGADATALVLRHAFADMGLNRVELRVLAFNEAAVQAYTGCGFVVEGRERESCWLDGEPHDDIIMGVLAADSVARDPA